MIGLVSGTAAPEAGCRQQPRASTAKMTASRPLYDIPPRLTRASSLQGIGNKWIAPGL
ncbi:hypothetical protein C4K05_0646 [Pseudomonas chlororaphis subsp. aureofaciens]|uniref:Uncharacterized protein n=1 Tax=Pseudomonas chlororaphis subsp. aureofaciens TaxID=587851 RepID=A0AAD0ZAQ4_9PSED|nr:hypothetical protein C4K14_0638 [Pseudomonas chlororaphis subsp. aureofaciens]AZD90070.1 hypothetical protein C4K13_0626 [Pseudomonas chlororaphis subsp. aureofaciens]AZD96519.1 hypothetical protein C4K12_0626 [Pseudomonas chlororaphis subsp. aureofaciens]AZE02815.1 hypothetical protein C4K11_0626 [Pseudomonas chlororaphis subsp. aureofaciens]AZE08930.1 hypothetical protein C4K10_0623 [Pseudomonas chlororaphis subsp. aureofaciens]